MGSITSYDTSVGRRYRVRFRTPDRRQTDKRGFRTKRDAELFLASVELSKARGEFVPASQSRVLLGEWARDWFKNQVQLTPATRMSYDGIVRAIIAKWGSVALGDLTHVALQGWLTEISTKLAPSTTRHYHRVLSLMLKYAVRDGRLSRNPADGIRLPRIVKRQHGYLSHAQVHLLAEIVGDDGDMILFLGYTGLRWGEMAALRVMDLDMLRRRVNVNQAVTEVGKAGLVYGMPKNHSRRSVPFTTFLVDLLAARCAGRRPTDFVFTAPAGGALNNHNWRRRRFEPAVTEFLEINPGAERFTIHDLRHTAASLAISAGANVKAVQKMLGHASAAMTLDVYADLFDDDLDAVGAALSEAGDRARLMPLPAHTSQPLRRLQ